MLRKPNHVAMSEEGGTSTWRGGGRVAFSWAGASAGGSGDCVAKAVTPKANGTATASLSNESIFHIGI